MARLDATQKRKDNLETRICDIIAQVIRDRLSHAEQVELFSTLVWNSCEYLELPNWAREWLLGFAKGRRILIEREIIFAYKIEGAWLPIDCTEYLEYSPSEVFRLHSQCGYIWRSDNTKVYFIGDSYND